MTLSEEDYIKAIYHLGKLENVMVSTNAIAEKMDTKPSSVTDMIKKLSEKGFINHKRYQGVTLTELGRSMALGIVRKHRLWEVFLVDKLNFNWDEVHEVAEQLEHIKSEKLVDKLDKYLGHPKLDPHGDPIPDRHGNIKKVDKILISACEIGDIGKFVGVINSSSDFLRYLDKLKLELGSKIQILSKEDFDGSFQIKVNQDQLVLSAKAAKNMYIQKIIP
jgi:DtxR family Mn-dependent transcriptional regulator